MYYKTSEFIYSRTFKMANKNLIASKTLKQYIKFCLVGGIGYVLALIVMYIFTDMLGWYYIASSAVAFVVASISNFTLNRVWTFRPSEPGKEKEVNHENEENRLVRR